MNYAKEITVTDRFLNFPVKNDAPKCLVSFSLGGKKVREFTIELAESEPDFWTSSDISEYQGLTLAISIEGFAGDPQILAAIEPDSRFAGGADLYHEKLRPQFHFSARRGWLNDPNGLLFYQGEYHLFFQHNPFGWSWGNMHWGHAVSPDLMYWQELPDALYPDEMGTMFSGSGVVDRDNTAEFKTGAEDPLVLICTIAGSSSQWSEGKPFCQGLAYSNDRGRTWTKYPGNPVVSHLAADNRDPKVFWHELSKHWVMALYLDKSEYALLISQDLKHWEKTCTVELPGGSECPDFFELAVDGDFDCKKWVFWGANGYYLTGSFDGRHFLPESEVLQAHQGNHFYAAQTWSGIPDTDGRRIQIGWATQDLPGMPFNKFMTLPTELELKNTSAGIRLVINPVQEIEKLHGQPVHLADKILAAGLNPLAGIQGELFDLEAAIEIGTAQCLLLNIRGVAITYDPRQQQLACLDKTAALSPENGRIKLRILVDRASIEIFANGGLVYMPMGVVLDAGNQSLELTAVGGEARLVAASVYPLQSIW